MHDESEVIHGDYSPLGVTLRLLCERDQDSLINFFEETVDRVCY